MFSVIFEVHPKPNKWDAYLDNAKMLRPELEQVDGFIDNIRYKSLSRKGWILSLSGWRDEKSVVRWRTAMRHHMVQEKGRSEILLDYHLRVGQVIRDTHVPAGQKIEEQRLDETEIGEGHCRYLHRRSMAAHVVRYAKCVRGRAVSRIQAGSGRAGKLGRLRRRTDTRRPDPDDGVEEES